MKSIATLLCCGIVVLLSACASAPYEGQFDGFQLSQESDVLHAPPAGKSRIYAFTPTRYRAVGAYNHWVSGHYHFDRDKYTRANDVFFILRHESSTANFVDINRFEPFVIYGKASQTQTIQIKPKPNRIYCLRSELLTGWRDASMFRPKFDLVSQATCEKELRKINLAAEYKKQAEYALKFDARIDHYTERKSRQEQRKQAKEKRRQERIKAKEKRRKEKQKRRRQRKRK